MARPTLRRRRLVRALQKLREDAALNVSEAAKLVGFSQTKLSRIEAAQIGINGDDTHALCTAYGVAPEVTDALVKLARQARSGRRDWWRPYTDVLGKGTDWIELEADSVREHTFTIDVIPGLLQTEAYCRAMMSAAMPRESTETVQKRVAARMERQQRLTNGGLELWAIIDEPALRRPIGGSEVVADQVRHLIDMARSPHVSIQVLSQDIGAHFALGAPFHTFILDDGLGVVALDDLTGGLFIEDDNEVRVYEDTWSRLAAIALSFDHSKELLRVLSEDQRRTVSEPQPNVGVEEKHKKRQ